MTADVHAIRVAGKADPFHIPPEIIPADKHYQWASKAVAGLGDGADFNEFRKMGFAPVPHERHADRYDRSADGFIEVGGLILVEKDKGAVEHNKIDQLVMNLLANAAARHALGSEEALFDGDSVGNAFRKIIAAYGDVAFRDKWRDMIRARARSLASEVHLPPDVPVVVEEPRATAIKELGGLKIWFASPDRTFALWRVFVAPAIMQLKETLDARTSDQRADTTDTAGAGQEAAGDRQGGEASGG